MCDKRSSIIIHSLEKGWFSLSGDVMTLKYIKLRWMIYSISSLLKKAKDKNPYFFIARVFFNVDFQANKASKL